MDSKKIIERIKDVSLLRSDTDSSWNKTIMKFPYFSVGQWLKYGHDNFYQKGDLRMAYLYRSDPIEFATFVKRLDTIHETNVEETIVSSYFQEESKQYQIQNESIIHANGELVHDQESPETFIHEVIVEENKIEEIPEMVSVPNDQEETDILELINGLPNSLAFELPESIANIDTSIENKEIHHNELDLGSIENNYVSSESLSNEQDQSLMVMMSFTDWLNHFKHKSVSDKIEASEKKALKTAWQKEKLAEAADEELDEIPEPIFKQAMESISFESSLISEALAEILAKQGKTDKAIAMYKKLSLRNPEKNTFFADRISELNAMRE